MSWRQPFRILFVESRNLGHPASVQTSMEYRFIGALVALFLALPAAAQAPVVPGEPAWVPKAAVAARLHLADDAVPTAERLAPVAPEEVQAVRERNARARIVGQPQAQSSRLTVGVSRPAGVASIGAADFAWKPVPGGYAAQVAVTSPEAGSLRLAIDLAGVPAEVEMLFFGSDNASRLEGPVKVGDISDRTRSWWSPLTEGETQTVEFFVPRGNAPARL